MEVCQDFREPPGSPSNWQEIFETPTPLKKVKKLKVSKRTPRVYGRSKRKK